MKQLLLTFLAVLLAGSGALAEPRAFRFDNDHTEVRFYWDHAGLSEQSGEWRKVRGTVRFDADRIEATEVSITIDAASVDTGVPEIDALMKGGNMFDVRRHPAITFVSTGVERTGEETARMRGKLTIKGQTEAIHLDVRLRHHGPHPMAAFLDAYKGEWLGVSATGRLFRSFFGISYGFPIVSDEIRLEISAELKAM